VQALMETASYGGSVQRFEQPQAASLTSLFRFDPLLLLAGVGLIGCSVYVLSAATENDIPGNPYYYVTRQAVYGGVGIILMLILSRFDYSRLRELKLGLYGAMIGLICLTFALGAAARGSQRWIALPFFNLQPSEVGKVLLILTLSAFAVDRVRRLDEWRTTSRIVLLAAFPAMLVVAQPDLGSGMVYIVIAGAVLFIAGTKWTHFLALGTLLVTAIVVVLIAAPAAGFHVLKPYQVDRLTAFANPSDNPRGQGYQLNQSIIGIGAGQKTGRGADGATQTKLNFLPEHHTDFIFSVVGEAYGFLGCALILSLYALLIWRGLRILTMAKNLYGALIAGGVTAMLMFQVFVNVGMSIGIMPITGVPLPLMSYGGSSVLVTFLALGLLQSVYLQARNVAAAKGRELLP
jgi:rod shape determining protein RodA